MQDDSADASGKTIARQEIARQDMRPADAGLRLSRRAALVGAAATWLAPVCARGWPACDARSR